MTHSTDLLDKFSERFSPKRSSPSDPPHEIYSWIFNSGYDACLAEVRAFLEEEYGVRIAPPVDPELEEPRTIPVDQLIRE